LLETIKIKNRTIFNIQYHNERFNRARQELFQCSDILDLEESIELALQLDSGMIKCRVLYRQEIERIEYHPYGLPKISSLKKVHTDNIDYSFKYEDRSALIKLLSLRTSCDDILIIKQGRITDTSFCNIVFFDGSKWITPRNPLLKGTKRAKLLQEHKIIEDDVYNTDLKHFKHAGLINSMIDLEDRIWIDIDKIYE